MSSNFICAFFSSYLPITISLLVITTFLWDLGQLYAHIFHCFRESNFSEISILGNQNFLIKCNNQDIRTFGSRYFFYISWLSKSKCLAQDISFKLAGFHMSCQRHVNKSSWSMLLSKYISCDIIVLTWFRLPLIESFENFTVLSFLGSLRLFSCKKELHDIQHTTAVKLVIDYPSVQISPSVVVQ